MTLKSEILSISALFGEGFSLFVDTYCLRISIHDKYENCRKRRRFTVNRAIGLTFVKIVVQIIKQKGVFTCNFRKIFGNLPILGIK